MLENLLKEGSAVFAKVNPDIILNVRRYLKRIYHRTIQNNPSEKGLVYFEKELIPVRI